jgi:hypothetical protein
MAGTFEIHGRQHWTFQLVLLGARLQLEGWCEAAPTAAEGLHCSAWMDPLQDPHDVAHALIEHPSCAL